MNLYTKDEWDVMVFFQLKARYVPARCCGKTIYYWWPGDEWCDEHRCNIVTRYDDRCSRRADESGLCGQHFSRGVRKLLGEVHDSATGPVAS